MHRLMRELLPGAKGESRLVVVVFLDVRGFSSFARLAESSEAALFLRSMYTRILDDYFPDASFFKPTGDGLLVVLDYGDDNLADVVAGAVNRSVKLVDAFGEITAGDQMVNFEVPGDLGIGIARGAATALVSDGRILDYSGRPLNLAARLMDLARPSGVVFSESLGPSLLGVAMEQFERHDVYVKGIAEDEPVTVFSFKDRVEIPEFNTHPLNRYEWKTLPPEKVTFKTLKERKRFFLHKLPMEPALHQDIRVHVRFPDKTTSGRRHPSMRRNNTFKAVFAERAGVRYARVDYGEIVANLLRHGVKDAWECHVTVEYAVRPS